MYGVDFQKPHYGITEQMVKSLKTKLGYRW
jgi:hypothetical protein